MRFAPPLLLLSFLLASTSALAAPAIYYGGAASPRARAPLEIELENLVAEVARSLGREAPRSDPRLGRAAEAIAKRLSVSGRAERPPSELVEAALWMNGLVEPPPHLILAGFGPGGEAALIAELRTQLAEPIAHARFRRVGAAVVASPRGSEVIVALAESFVELEAVPRELETPGELRLAGRLLAPYQNPEAFVTSPDGRVTRIPLAGGAGGFAATVRAGPSPGRYQVEVAGEDRFGAAVLANFPLYAGVQAPITLPTHTASPGDSFTSAVSAEALLVQLVNADRARARLPPLEHDARLSAVARGHSADMQAHGFLGHVSPSTGTAADRLRSAHVDAQVVMENVARAYSPGEAERGLMDSPGHRANILSSEPTRVGVGVVIASGMGGVKELLVTQLFTRPTEKLAGDSQSQLHRRIDGLRRARGLGALDGDPALDAIALESAQKVGRGELPPERAGTPLEKALGQLSSRYSAVRSVVAVAGSLSQITAGVEKSLTDPALTACGIGLAEGKRTDGSAALFAVIVLATRR